MTRKRLWTLLRAHGPIVALCAGVFTWTGWISLKIFHDIPFCMDEYNYAYQSKIFASGRLFLRIPETYHKLVELYMVHADGKLLSKYGPLWAAVLAIGQLVGWPGLVNPALSAITVFMVYRIALPMAGQRHAFYGAAILATTSYFCGYGASYYAHSFALAMATAGLWALQRYERTGRRRAAVTCGAISGLLCLSRPGDAAALAAAMCLGMIFMSWKWNRRKGVIDALVCGGVASLGPLVLALYNHALIGKFSLAAYAINDQEFRILAKTTTGSTWDVFLESVKVYFREFAVSAWPNLKVGVLRKMGWAFPILVVLGFLGGRGRFKWIVLAHVLIIVCLYNFHPGRGWPQYGARYWYSGIGGLAVVAALGLAMLSRETSRETVAAVFAAAIAVNYMVLTTDLAYWHKRFDMYLTVQADIPRHCPEPAYVYFRKPPPGSRYDLKVPDLYMYPDSRRNEFFKGPHLFPYAPQGSKIAAFPDLPVCFYDVDVVDGGPLHPPLY